MATQDFRPEVEERLQYLDLSVHQPDAELVDDLIKTYMASPKDAETHALARRVFTSHREFFDLIGDR